MRRPNSDDTDDGDQSIIERKGKIDLEKLVQKRNSGNTVEHSMIILKDYLVDELLLAQDQKDIHQGKKQRKLKDSFKKKMMQLYSMDKQAPEEDVEEVNKTKGVLEIEEEEEVRDPKEVPKGGWPSTQ